MEIVKMGGETWLQNKGGRPKKTIKKDCCIGVWCTQDQKKLISAMAKVLNQGPGEYLRNLGLNRQGDLKIKALPKEILMVIGTLNHLSANINQLAKKRNAEYNLSNLDAARLAILATEVKELAVEMKNYLK
jgi:hypothetical protein